MRSILAGVLFVAACGGSSEAIAPATPDPSTPTTPTPPASPTSPEAGAPSAASDYFPPATGTWETVTAADAGFDPAKLDELATFVEQSRSTTFMILYEGRILVEKYWSGADATTLQDVASAQKSVLSMLVGQLISKGTLAFDDTVTSILGAGWSNASAAEEAPITMRHLLTMTSGLDASLGFAAPAGTTWLYNTDAYHRTGLAVVAKTGKSLQDHTREAMFDAIGVGTSEWSTRGLVKDSKGMPVDALLMNARDMARVGLLMMHRGTWRDQVIVPNAYVTEAMTPSQTFNPSYGFLFWLNGQASALLPPAQPHAGMLMPSAPPDLVAALGAADQKIHASTAAKLVVVRQGASAGGLASAASDWDETLWQHIVAAQVK